MTGWKGRIVNDSVSQQLASSRLTMVTPIPREAIEHATPIECTSATICGVIWARRNTISTS